jgi:hypothetical protein
MLKLGHKQLQNSMTIIPTTMAILTSTLKKEIEDDDFRKNIDKLVILGSSTYAHKFKGLVGKK